jgi:hypothetical protein
MPMLAALIVDLNGCPFEIDMGHSYDYTVLTIDHSFPSSLFWANHNSGQSSLLCKPCNTAFPTLRR